MAKVIPGNIDPNALPRVRGKFLVRPLGDGYVAQAWPKPRGPARTWNQRWNEAQFGYAAKMASNPEPMSLATAEFFAQGTDYVPRDILMMAAYGKLYDVILPDGTVAPISDHSAPPEPVPPAPPDAMAWDLVGHWPGSPVTAQIDFTGLGGYTEALIVARLVTKSGNATANYRLSDDNGATFYTTSGDYVQVDDAGAETAFNQLSLQSQSTTAARSGLAWLAALDQLAPKPAIRLNRSAPGCLFTPSVKVNAVRVFCATTFTGGNIYLFAR